MWSVDWGTSQTGFCSSCHIMKEFAMLRQNSAHSKKSNQDISCTSCHLPGSNFQRIPKKIQSGIKDITVQISQRPLLIEHFDQHYKQRKDFVYDDNCIKCHEHGLQSENLLSGVDQLHTHVLYSHNSLMSCLDCHQGMEHGRKPFFNWDKTKAFLSEQAVENELAQKYTRDIVLKTCFACHSKRGEGIGNFNAFDYHQRPSDYYALKVGINIHKMPPTPFLRNYAVEKMDKLEELVEGG